MAAMFLTLILCSFIFPLAMAEYGIVYPTLLTARDSDGKKILKVNERMTLNLEKSEVFSGDFMFVTEENGKRTHLLMSKDEYEKDLYHDQSLMAALLVRSDDGVQVEGIINDTLRIKPLLERPRSMDGHIPHELFQVPPRTDTPPMHRDYKPANITETGNSSSPYVEARSRSKGYYPEVYIVQDYVHAEVFKFNKNKVVEYFSVFCAAVNLRYATNRGIKIQLRIAGITMSTTEEKYMVYPGRSRYEILDEQTLAEFNKYYQNKIEFIESDLVFLVTGRDMVFYEKGVLQYWVGGYSYIGGFCQQTKVGMSEDPPGSFYGVQVFAHEVGHSLGCVHDQSPAEPSVPGHQGSEACSWYDSYMMSYAMTDSRMYSFSKCCIADIKNVLSRSEWSCLRTRNPKSTRPKGLPGQHVSGNEYCKRCYPGRNGMHYNREYGIKNCKLNCRDSKDSYMLGAPDGVPCDAGRRGSMQCKLGECMRMRTK
uniref:Reprolysin n=1 Tax=Rhipicephalus appendiculatus TaxID=34631 RepID=A0A131YKL8_RHIAP